MRPGLCLVFLKLRWEARASHDVTEVRDLSTLLVLSSTGLHGLGNE